MRCFFGIFSILSFIGCTESTNFESNAIIHIPKHFETLNFGYFDDVSESKVELGERLFFDNRLSKNQNISCASCHQPQFAFADSLPVSVGTNNALGLRNTPSIINVAFKKSFHKDGGVKTLELQVLAPIIDTNELGADFLIVLERIKQDTEYVRLFKQAFDTIPNVFGITRSIAAYERSLVMGNSKYDQYILGDSNALTETQKNGLKLFNSKRLNCVTCHSGILFSDFTYQNVGLEHQFEDSGRARITFRSQDAGKFEVPSLRNVAITPPYMHDGSMKDLNEVILYLETGGGSHPNKSNFIQPFSLSIKERNELIEFLQSLTDQQFIK
jgi:cytochrome c peroxidase